MAMDEGIKSRASSLLTQLDCLPPHKLAPSARSRLSKLLRSEIRFLHGLSDHTASALNRVVPDTPSARVMNLCETGKIKEKNKVVFGTGDCWQAPTLTANLSFVRAVRQTGMALSVLEHKPRALVGEKCR